MTMKSPLRLALASHLNEEENTQLKDKKNYDLDASVVPDILP
jgi:hypothetical protein